MQNLQAEFAELLRAEAASKDDLLTIFKELGYERILEFENKISAVFKTQYLKTIENYHLNKFKDLLLSKLATIEN